MFSPTRGGERTELNAYINTRMIRILMRTECALRHEREEE